MEIKEKLLLGISDGYDYIQQGLYEEYLQDKVHNENRLANMITETMILTESGLSLRQRSERLTVLYEAKIGDKIKSGWQKFIGFIKRIFAKFMETITRIIYDQKGYLERYKDIILTKKGKDLDYSYTGNYKEGLNRIANTELPLFNYETHKENLKKEGDGPIVNQIMNGKNFKYNDSDTLAEQFKEYFIAGDLGQTEGKLSDINFTDLYNFCIKFEKTKAVIDKDISHLESSTQAINNAITAELNALKNQPQEEKTEDSKEENQKPEVTAQAASAINRSYRGGWVNEVEQAKTDTQKAAEKKTSEDKPKTSTGLKVSTDFSQVAGSYSDDSKDADNKEANQKASATAAAEDAKKDDKMDLTVIDNMTNKWTTVCRAILTAKLTAVQQISKDYMEIISTHVRSYGGQSKNDKEGDRAKQAATEYKQMFKNLNLDKSEVEQVKKIVVKAKENGKSPEETVQELQNNNKKISLGIKNNSVNIKNLTTVISSSLKEDNSDELAKKIEDAFGD